MTVSGQWQQRVGSQRDWIWRGWQTRYTYLRSPGFERQGEPPVASPPLILLHGFGASIGHWRNNLADLAQHHTVYALDMLGFGASQKATAQYNVSLWVEQVYEFWKTFINEPVVLVGNSIGSLVCLAAAEAHPEMVRGIVMLSLPDPSVREEAIPAWLRPIITTVEGVVASPALLKTIFYFVRRPSIVRRWAGIAYANPTAVTEELVEILAGPAQDRGSAQAFCAILKAMASSKFGPSVKKVLQNLKIPMLLIWGREDRMIPPGLARQFGQHNTGLQVVELENAGHCLHDECPEQVNKMILEWLNEQCAGAPVQPSPSASSAIFSP
ncbi:MAG: alpha/beta fold hydrolase [Microcoleus vaginatus WJT46-NPBG5]|nr:alpha/beta fold hydrolase [Microcoleus vaginatus WJT46-NPBG5]